MAGAKRISPDKKKATGARDRTTKNARKVKPGVPTPTEFLGPIGLTWFERLCDRLQKINNLSPEFGELITIAAQNFEEIETLTDDINNIGYVYETTGTDGQMLVKPNPAVNMRNNARSQAIRCLAEMGLTQTALLKFGQQDGDEEDPFEKFLSKKR